MKFKLPSIKELRAAFMALPIVVRFFEWIKQHSLPGFRRVPIYDVAVFFLREIQRDNITTRANSIAFSFFLSIFPSILVIFTLIPYILPYFDFLIVPNLSSNQLPVDSTGSVDVNSAMVQLINELISKINIIPLNAKTQLINFLEEITTQPRAGLLSFGFLLALFFASNGMISLMRGFEKSNNTTTFHRRNILVKRLIAIQMVFIIVLLVTIAVVMIILGDWLLWLLSEYWSTGWLYNTSLDILRWLLVISLFYFGITMIYRVGVPARKKFRLFSPGATLATLLSLITTLIFSLYVDNFGNYNKLYGSIGTIIVIMLWIQLNALVLLIGFELNASIAVNRDLKKASQNES
ncbi:MAG: YihY/virulence factor BrkB family protein [Bacteroidota bacterium]